MKKKTVMLVAAIAMILCLAVGGTLAYFTDTTETAENVFTVGKVGIELTETDWNPEDDHTLNPGHTYAKNPTITVDSDSNSCYAFLTIDANKYVSLINLMGLDAYENKVAGLSGEYPGFTAFFTKLMSGNAVREAVVDRWFTGIDHEAWTIMNVDEIKAGLEEALAAGKAPEHMQLVLGYNTILAAGDKVVFMTAFGMPETVSSEMFEVEGANFNSEKAPFKLSFTASAIQSDMIEDLATAYDELF